MKPWPAWTLAFCLMAAFPARASGDAAQGSPAPILDRIAAALSGITSISSDFTQERRTSLLEHALWSSGRFFYRSPDCLRWEVAQPDNYGFAVCGGRGARWSGRGGPVQEFSMDQEPALKLFADQMLAWVRGDFPWLASRFRIVPGEGNPVTLKLLPRDPAESGGLAHVLVAFSADLARVTSVEVLERDGDLTRIRFSGTLINPQLDPGLFP